MSLCRTGHESASARLAARRQGTSTDHRREFRRVGRNVHDVGLYPCAHPKEGRPLELDHEWCCYRWYPRCSKWVSISTPVECIDYRCDNRRFSGVRPWWSSSNPNFSKPRSRAADSDVWSRLTHQLLGRLKSTIPILQIFSPKNANSEKLGLRIDNPCRIVFLSLRMSKCL